MSHYQLVVGLGNPGKKYALTRHNAGFMLLDTCVAQRGLEWTEHPRWQALMARDGETYWLKPQTFMNLSGECVQAVRSFYQISVEKILVVYDEMDLELGQIRLKRAGSAGGHNGMKNMIACLGTDKIDRLRIGIGQVQDKVQMAQEAQSASSKVSALSRLGSIFSKQQNHVSTGRGQVVNHVLGNFSPAEQDLLKKTLDFAQEAVTCCLSQGIELAMNRFNQKQNPFN